MYHINKEITGSGESFVLNNTAKHYFKDFKILGNSKQETRQGYNLVDFSSKGDFKNDILTASGTASWGAKLFDITDIFKNNPGKTLYFSCESFDFSNSNKGFVQLIYSTSEKISYAGMLSNAGNFVPFKISTDTSDITNVTLGIYYNNTTTSGTTYTTIITKPMLAFQDNLPYEQYGASPSIEYEAPIESVGDNINYFPTDESEWEQGGVSSSTGENANNTARLRTKDFIDIPSNQCYLSIQNINYIFVNIIMYNDSNTFVGAYGNIDYSIVGSTSLAVTFPSECKKIKVVVRKANDSTITPTEISTIKPKLGKGTKATPYSPYGQGSVEIINLNKNLIEMDNIAWRINNNAAYEKIGVNEIKVNAKAGNYSGIYTRDIKVQDFRQPIVLSFYMKADKNCRLMAGTSGSERYTFDITTNYQRIIIKDLGTNTTGAITFYGSNLAEDLSFYIKNIMVSYEEGDYTPHQSQTKVLHTQQPLRRIGDVRDKFVKQNGIWYEEHKIKRIIFDGTENWYQSASNGLIRFQTRQIKDMLQQANRMPIYSNYLRYASTGDFIGLGFAYYIENGSIYLYPSAEITTVELMKKWLANLSDIGTPLYVDYVLETPTLIECTAEQVEVLEYFEKEAYSYDEVTHIYSTDLVSPYFEVAAYQRISEEFKTRLKQGKITRGYLKVLASDTLPEIIIDENNYLKDLKIEELRYVPEEGFIGGTVAKRVSGNFNNVDNSFNIQDREVEVYLGVELEDETTEYINYGTYIVQRPEDDQVNDNTSFEALDYMIKFNLEYEDRITYPCTLKQLFDDVVDQAGVTSKVATFPNADFIVEDNQFETGTTLRDVLKAIAQMAFNWTRIDQDNNLVMDFEIKDTVDEELGPDDYFNYKKSDYYGPINTLVLRNSQVEGENITIKDDNIINSAKGDNILPITLKSQTINGVEITVNKDNSITLNGQATEAIILTFSKTTMTLKGNYTFYVFGKSSRINFQGYENGSTVAYLRYADTNEFITKEYLVDTTITNLFCFINANTIYNNETFKFMITKGTEVKQYEPYISIGEIEYVIADNPFAYTQEKRAQLIEAGRKLFGLKYSPMTMDMIGFMYLNATDRIAATNLNGETYHTYLLNHTIDYTGVVLDSMESPAKTKTETKYQFTPQMMQALKHTEIKVDKARQEILLIAEKQEGLEEQVAKQEITLEGISSDVKKVEEVVDRTVARVEVVYALSDSPTQAPTSGWSTTAPEWVAGKYMWQKTITTYSDGSTAESAVTNISGAKGEEGKDGIGITQTNITYQKSTSGTTVPTGTWQTTIPEVDEDSYLWTRTEFVYSDGSKKYAYSVGKKGATGIGVKSLVDQYYLSTSDTEQIEGEWKETQDAWEEGKYIWTRTKIIWTNDSVTYTTPILANTLNDINSNIIVLKEFNSQQSITNSEIKSSVEETTKRLTNDYLTAEQVNSKIDGLDEEYEILEKRVASTELTAGQFQVQIDKINNQGVDKITTSVGYTFDDTGLNIDRTGADTATTVNEKGIEVSDKTGSSSTPLLYAGYVEEGNTDFPDYEGQTIVAASNLIVKNYLVIGLNSRFQDYINPTLGGQGTGAFDI